LLEQRAFLPQVRTLSYRLVVLVLEGVLAATEKTLLLPASATVRKTLGSFIVCHLTAHWQ
jgi:hypothetical protein